MLSKSTNYPISYIWFRNMMNTFIKIRKCPLFILLSDSTNKEISNAEFS